MRQLFASGAFALSILGCAGLAAAAKPAHHVLAMQAPSPDINEWAASPTAHKTTVHKSGAHVWKFTNGLIVRTSRLATELTHNALRFLGTPYVFGGTSRYGFDCSGYTQHVFAMAGVSIPRMADAQFYAGSRTRGGMRPGDLVFFQTYEPGPSHVGIYLGNGAFAHASSSHGVMVSHLSDPYWSSRYLGAKRLLASSK